MGSLLFLSGRGFALDASIVFEKKLFSNGITIEILDLDERRIREGIQKGFSSKIQYRLRVYRENEGLAQLLGDELLFETHPSLIGRWDVFSESYEILFEDGRKQYFMTWEDFSRRFFQLSDFSVPDFEGSRIYLLAQVLFQDMVLSPPLNLLTVFFDRHTLRTPWRRLEMKK